MNRIGRGNETRRERSLPSGSAMSGLSAICGFALLYFQRPKPAAQSPQRGSKRPPCGDARMKAGDAGNPDYTGARYQRRKYEPQLRHLKRSTEITPSSESRTLSGIGKANVLPPAAGTAGKQLRGHRRVSREAGRRRLRIVQHRVSCGSEHATPSRIHPRGKQYRTIARIPIARLSRHRA